MFILAEERDKNATVAFENYAGYLASVGDRFPPRAFELATSDWWFNFNDHNCPHDAWLEQALVVEPSSGERHEKRHTELQLTLLSAYHDVRIQLAYSGVTDLKIDALGLAGGHGDWRYDEFRVTDDGLVVHEIEWAGFSDGSRWIDTAEDVAFHAEIIQTK